MATINPDPPALDPQRGPQRVAAVTLCVLLAWALTLQRHPPRPPAVATASAPAGVDPNVADLDELQSLPGIGPYKARAIAAYRADSESPAFRSAQDLLAVPGIGPRTLQSLRPLLRFDAPSEPHQLATNDRHNQG